MKSILERIAEGEILIADGAMGTLLQGMGLEPGECPEEWNISHPNEVKSIAKAYADAGSDIVETNSFGGTSYKLAEYGLEGRVAELNTAAVCLAKEGSGGRAYVAASVGPTGQIPYDEGGEATEEDLYKAFFAQISALAAGGTDVICIETMSSIIEAREAVRAAKAACMLPVICTFSFEPGARGFHTMMGATPAQAASMVRGAGADIVGANCGNGIERMIEVTREIRAQLPGTPILINANAGVPVFEDGVTVFKDTPEDMASFVPELIKAGASIIGGCCGTTPAHIRAIAKAVRG